jgi:hypothetical protein
MTASTSSSPSTPGTPGPPEPRHRASGGRGYGRETETSGPVPPARRPGGRHRAPDAPPSSGFTIVPGPRGPGSEAVREPDGPGAGFRPLPPSGPTAPPAPGLSSIGVPLGAVPAQREPATPRPRRPEPDAAIPRRRPARTDPDAGPDDEAVTVPIRRDVLDGLAARPQGSGEPTGSGSTEAVDTPPLQPLTVQRPTTAVPPRPAPGPRTRARPTHALPTQALPAQAPDGAASRPTATRPATRPASPRRGVAPWETPPVDQPSTRLGLVAVAVGLLGALVALAPWSGLLPRVLPASSLGITPAFTLVGALLGVVALGLGAIAMFRAVATSRGLFAGVVGACAGAAAIVVGLVV